MDPCKAIDKSKLTAWVDRERTDSKVGVKDTLTAHVADCPQCAAWVAELQAHRERMRQYRAATTPESLPSDFWHNLQKGMDRQDRAQPPTHAKIPRPIRGPIFVGALLICLGAFGLPALWPRLSVPISQLLNQPVEPVLHPGEQRFTTNDADKAARWLSEQLGADIPTINLALIHADIAEVQANISERTGLMLYHTAQGVPLSLHIFPNARIDTHQTHPVRYAGDVYSVDERAGSPKSLVLWESEGHTFAAVAPLSAQAFLPYVHEMSLRCRATR